MRSLLALVAILMVATLSAPAQSLKLVGSVTIDAKELLSHSQTLPTEFVLPNKKTAGKFNALDVYEILKPQLKSLSAAELRHTIIVAESANGETTAFSVAEIQPELSKVPAMLLLTAVGQAKSGMIAIQDSSLKRGRVDIGQLDAVFGETIRRKVGLQLQTAPKSPAMSPLSIIFPIDARTDRWPTEVKKLTIYIVTP